MGKLHLKKKKKRTESNTIFYGRPLSGKEDENQRANFNSQFSPECNGENENNINKDTQKSSNCCCRDEDDDWVPVPFR